MEAARTSETLVNIYQTTRRYNPEDSHLNISCWWQSYWFIKYYPQCKSECILIFSYWKWSNNVILFCESIVHTLNTWNDTNFGDGLTYVRTDRQTSTLCKDKISYSAETFAYYDLHNKVDHVVRIFVLNSMEHSPPWEDDSRLAGREVSAVHGAPNIH
jgi:hypothetical protein